MRERRTVLLVLVALCLFVATSAESCQKASSDLNKASQGLDALNATCSDLQSDSARQQFAQAEADQANRSDQPESQTKQQALDSLDKHCGGSQNPSYQPYVDVQTDISSP